MTSIKNNKPRFIALLPLFVFVFTFLGVGIYQNDFYALPAPIAVIAGIIVAFLIFKQSIKSKIETLLAGCGDSKILTMCLIYLLAGAFATITKETGSVDAIVNLGLDFIAIQYIYFGVFIIAAFLSISTGTSVGAIVALTPIVIGFADKGGVSLAILCGALLGGSMFGDNLSVISDTTIAATQSLGVKMSDKFKQNIKIALPAALFTIAILIVKGAALESNNLEDVTYNYSLLKIVPYILVIALSVIGVNVFVTLLLGVLIAAAIGIFYGDFTLIESTKIAYNGFTSMTEIFLLSLLSGGLAALVAKNGGIDYILNKIKTLIKSKKSAQFGIATLVSTVNMAIANNTVSIIISGSIAKTINDEYKLDNKNTASILDIFACITQGLLPYGAQVLMILSFSDGNLTYTELIGNTWYLLLLFIYTIIYISLYPFKLKKTSIN
ncbi:MULTISPECIES: Na+/H+ antiporter NhaC family protein [unclassified Cellulophaga]|uniref:Na+/H+ antiporter NhaC family protein n=1 Tax=unclassified Cellulophaga TaxID=2634405 RepID=UPI0026E180CB|nr:MULTISPECIES: Na+/H+ antiporter NhaC family protein [unclassified Cellulophaga]MDO6492489.1 Na+/H+ antiporter NhaC family protein [Cellulophaga sp. 2_MG-2023]MDO6493591.1 Na+/H+ antiporter NhaC family protein [Cellulophaga sp. 3_MG-2023]